MRLARLPGPWGEAWGLGTGVSAEASQPSSQVPAERPQRRQARHTSTCGLCPLLGPRPVSGQRRRRGGNTQSRRCGPGGGRAWLEWEVIAWRRYRNGGWGRKVSGAPGTGARGEAPRRCGRGPGKGRRWGSAPAEGRRRAGGEVAGALGGAEQDSGGCGRGAAGGRRGLRAPGPPARPARRGEQEAACPEDEPQAPTASGVLRKRKRGCGVFTSAATPRPQARKAANSHARV